MKKSTTFLYMWMVAPAHPYSHISHTKINKIIIIIIVIAKKEKRFVFTVLVTYRPLTPHEHRQTAPGLAFFWNHIGGFSQVQDTA